jgi:hypothetical protein
MSGRRIFLLAANALAQTSRNLAGYAHSASRYFNEVKNRALNLLNPGERHQLTLSVPGAQQPNPARELALMGARKRRRRVLQTAQTMRAQLGLAPDRRLAG